MMAGKRPSQGRFPAKRTSSLGLFGHLQGIVHFNPEVSDCAPQLGMPQKTLIGRPLLAGNGLGLHTLARMTTEIQGEQGQEDCLLQGSHTASGNLGTPGSPGGPPCRCRYSWINAPKRMPRLFRAWVPKRTLNSSTYQ